MKFLNRFRRKTTETQPAANPPDAKTATPGSSPEIKQPLPPKKAAPNPDELRFELGDFLHRIPAHLLQSGPHDLKTELCFEIKELSERIAKGQTTISLAEIYKRVPQIFRDKILDSDNIEVRFPWQKLARLVNSVRSGSKQPMVSTTEADILAEKLRLNKSTPVESPIQTSQQGPSVLPGIGGNQSAWFSKPTLDRPVEKARSPSASTQSPPTETPSLKLVDSVSQEAPTPKTDEDDLRISDLPADVARRVATIKGNYERQIAELERQSRLAIDARERNATETERLRAELDQAKGQLSAEKSAASMSRELLEKSSHERQLVQDELNARLKELADIQSQIASLKDESKVAALTSERDALIKQKDYLSTQIAEVTKRGQPPKAAETGGTAGMGAQRQVEELQRRIGTLEASQRENALIISREKELRAKAEKLLAAAEKLQEQSANHMESAKTEMRKEIEASFRQRENEARKSQKELQDQITVLSDHARKATVELENVRGQNVELQKQLEAACPAAIPQPDPLQAQLVAQLESDIENYRDRLKILIRERDEALVSVEKATPSSVVEMENLCSEKLKLEAELNEVRKLQEEQAASMKMIQEQAANDQQRAEKEHKAHEERVASLMQSIESAQRSLSEKRSSLEPALAEAKNELETLNAKYEELAATFKSEQESFEQERQQAAANLREQSLALEQQLTILVHERDQLRHDKDALAVRIKSEAEAREDLISSLDREHTSVVRANEELNRRLADTERALLEIEKEREHHNTSGAAMLGDPALQNEINALQNKLDATIVERDEAQHAAKTRNSALHESETTLNRLAAEHQQVVAEISEERAAKDRLHRDVETLRAELATLRAGREASASAESEILAGQLSEEREKTARISALLSSTKSELFTLRERHDAIAKSHESLVSEKQQLAATLAEMERDHHSTQSDLAAERESIAGTLKTARDEHARNVASLEAERDSSALTQKEADVEIARLRQELSAMDEASAVLKRRNAEEVAAISKANAALHEQHSAEIEKLSRAAQQNESAVAAEREAQQATAAALDEARSTAEHQASELDKLRVALATARHDYDELAQRAALEKSDLRQQLDAIAANKESLAHERETIARNAADLSDKLRKADDELANARKELASLQTEHEELARQRDELTHQLAHITDGPGVAQTATHSEPQHSPRPHSSTPPVIEVFEPEIVFPERENGVSLPRVRPVPIAPPKVGSR